MSVAALIVAAGRGTRAVEAGAAPKQYRLLGGLPMLARSIGAFAHHPNVDAVAVVINPDDTDLYAATSAPFATRLRAAVPGGARRQDSVRLGLEALAARDAPSAVLIHDAARPFADADLITRVIAGLKCHAGALPCLPVTDTLKRGADGRVTGTVDRTELWRAQTPQGFRFDTILAAHRAAAQDPTLIFTDDASVAEWYGLDVALVEGAEDNRKLTTAEDFRIADEMLQRGAARSAASTRVATGYDVHAFGPGDAVILCGVRIPHERALQGHSDADVALHALTDALLGTIGAGDIGVHFPPSDARWRGAPSEIFLRHAASLVAERGGGIVHVDISLICEGPRIAPYRDAMRARIAELLGLGDGQVSIKATTNEGLGFIGRGEGIAAMATATVSLP
ncbi:bifunctional 2-C-methyl-D-erythritol 4-phosphate cytidylyltransferase/2-C-methyl-D-erythritol 2,4-cyclodiphosphate synthase [Methyloceanibacter sp.]|uniref:bifunctional 2-C-methyl-D-erythritol 4-phosphate cytidylyltransferase/2-C-methyl-D-erythritol 2,4-cyclodiphosphate synthase n=1 Tax=Methyloceanibacter sp. TaxID=1965321 RepID=UPI00351B7834